MAIEIVDLPIDSMMIFQFAMLNYQRVHGTVNNNGIEWRQKTTSSPQKVKDREGIYHYLGRIFCSIFLSIS